MLTITCDNKKEGKVCGNKIEKLVAKHSLSASKGSTGIQIGKSHICAACLAKAFPLADEKNISKVFEA